MFNTSASLLIRPRQLATFTEQAHFHGAGLLQWSRPISMEQAHFYGAGQFPWSRPISMEQAYFYGAGPYTRNRQQYNESHVITAKFAPRNKAGSFVVPYEAELQTKRHCIVYDSNTDSLNEKGSPAVKCARMLWDNGSKNPVILIKGGYELFSAFYPFLRTQKIIYTQLELDSCETYPVEIIPGLLYSGTLNQGQNPAINKALKCKAHVNVSCHKDAFQQEENSLFENKIFNIPIEDSSDADIYSYFQNVVEFIDEFSQPGQSVLVCSERNISRSITVVMAYYMWKKHCTLEKAYAHVKKCKNTMQPSRSFIKDLSRWEEKLYGSVVTDITEPEY